jgi:nucleotide-binding universal stress UspA family protein
MTLEQPRYHGPRKRWDFAGADTETACLQRIKRILVPTDFSPCAARALDEAVALAGEWQATITVLYVVDLNLHTPPTGPANSEQLKAGLWQDGLGNLGQVLVGLMGKGVEVETLVREGLPREEIVRAALDHDLIVIGRRAKSFWQLFSRQTVKGVLDGAPCPVLVVGEAKEGARDNP